MRTNLEKLAVAQALYNSVGAVVSTKGSDSLRAECDKDARELYEQYGMTSRDVLINGEKVGTYSVAFAKGKPAADAWVEERAVLQDVEQFDTWVTHLDESSLRDLASWIRMQIGGDALAEYWLCANGELPDGCELLKIDHPAQPAQPKQYKNTVLKVDSQAVVQALAGELPDVVAGLLQGGEQDA